MAAITPVSTRCGISAAIHGARPKHKACATPKCGLRGQGCPLGRPPAGRVRVQTAADKVQACNKRQRPMQGCCMWHKSAKLTSGATPLNTSLQGNTSLAAQRLAAAHVGGSAHAPVLGPQRLEVHREADGAAAVHLGGLAVQLGYADLRRGRRVRRRDVELERELVPQQVVHVPALARPVRALLVGRDREPVAVGGLVELDVLYERCQLLRGACRCAPQARALPPRAQGRGWKQQGCLTSFSRLDQSSFSRGPAFTCGTAGRQFSTLSGGIVDHCLNFVCPHREQRYPFYCLLCPAVPLCHQRTLRGTERDKGNRGYTGAYVSEIPATGKAGRANTALALAQCPRSLEGGPCLYDSKVNRTETATASGAEGRLDRLVPPWAPACQCSGRRARPRRPCPRARRGRPGTRAPACSTSRPPPSPCRPSWRAGLPAAACRCCPQTCSCRRRRAACA